MLLALQTVALDAVFVLFCYTKSSAGGLSFSEADIGRALSLGGLATVAYQLSLFPRIQRRFGTVPLYRCLLMLYPLVFLLLPLCAWMAKREEGGARNGTWFCMGVYIVVKAVANSSYGCNMLASEFISILPCKPCH